MIIRSGIAALALVAGAEAAGAQEQTLRYAIQNPEGHVTAEAARAFGEALGKATEGALGIDLFVGGQLGEVKDVVQNLQIGAIDMTIVRPGHVADLGAERFNALSLPYVFSDDAHQDAVLFGEVGDGLLADLEAIDLKGVGFYRDLPRHFFFTDTPVDEIADMEGLKLRSQTSELAADTVSAFGAAPTPIPFSELYGALQSGVVDGGDQPLTGFYAQRYQEVADHIILDGHDASPIVVLMSLQTWNSLDEGQQQAVMEAHRAAAERFVEVNEAEVDRIRSELEEAGVTIIDVEDKTPWQEATAGLVEEYGADYPDLVEAIRAADE